MWSEFKDFRNQQREKRLDIFVNEILDDIVMQSPHVVEYEYDRGSEKFTITTKHYGKIDFFPKSNKLLIRKKNIWKHDGLASLLKFCSHTPKPKK